MFKKYELASYLLLASGLYCSHTWAAHPELTTITFANMSDQLVQQTQAPYLDNFSYYTSDTAYKFSAPTAVPVGQKMNATLSYDWWYNWYIVSQYAYNYPGRSADYGCFITEMGLSWEFNTYRIVIASYRKDPAFPNDYLTCAAKKEGTDKFTVTFQSSQTIKDYPLEDSQRYNIAGDDYELAHTRFFGIDKPIPLNPNFAQPNLVLKPNQMIPTVPQNNSTLVTHSSKDAYAMTIINHASVPIVAGTTLLDKFSRFNSQYFVEQPQIIAADSTAKISIGNPYTARDFDLERFNYHIEGYATDSGCFITTSTQWVTSPVASFYFDSQHPAENLYCLVTAEDTVEIYDDPLLAQLSAAGCQERDLKNCISTRHYFYKNGDTLNGLNFKYKILPVGPDASKYFLKVSPGSMDPTPYYLPPMAAF